MIWLDQKQEPKVGVGVIVVNESGRVLVGKRRGGHAPYYSIPGGHLELGESFESAAIREVKEETDLSIDNPQVIAVTNNLETFSLEGVHYISVILVATSYSGILRLMEPDKCVEWLWVDPNNLPMPHFDASRMGIHCYLEAIFYIPTLKKGSGQTDHGA
ncbi:nucleotide triphosphate diphosphatase NUDT15 [Sediminicola sp. 1XM1-17]|uniref:nucleotide triphosphate diphosphatase NUDT15 n=1 Tax=Sediminicola sp. 1XM1-17 TaxID=3127702 RepID=UPI003077C437